MEALQQIAAQLGLDKTFYPLFGLMLVLYLLLRTVYFKPFEKLLQERKQRTEGAKKEAQGLIARAEEKLMQYKARLKETNERARKHIGEAEEAAKKEESKVLSEAAKQAKASLQTIQKE